MDRSKLIHRVMNTNILTKKTFKNKNKILTTTTNMDMEQLQYGGTCDKNIDDDDIINSQLNLLFMKDG